VELKQLLTTSPVLALYDPIKMHRIAIDASNLGLGAVLEQKEEGGWRPVCYASRRLTATEARYAIIEREALAIVWACIKFHEFLMGKEFLVLTDHKPLITILGIKDINDISPRLQRMRLKLMPYCYTMEHVAGRDYVLPDWLSRNPQAKEASKDDQIFISEFTSYSRSVVEDIPLSDENLVRIQNASQKDPDIIRLKQHIQEGFPETKGKIGGELRKFWAIRNDLIEQSGMVLYKQRIVVPARLPPPQNCDRSC
jgi:hypothetical protein